MIQKIFRAFFPPIALFIFHVMAIYTFNIYERIPSFDIPMHFFGGGAIGLTTRSVYALLKKQGSIGSIPVWLYLFLGTAVVVFVAVGWEFAEFSADYMLGTVMQPGLADTMLDLFLGMSGGIVILIIGIFLDKKSVQ